ncbi:thiamine phosphate synthase [Desulfobulbus oligotrophicus]|jgi:thiamine-phosphate pyrophosphorylase|uniref:Thiamine-phosphate synthase n=1 Tax=Desulfobulbus oligotrophicus TaxID=1909699 RepID=A0A7T5VEN8_9BACT|nr:thiamine phosphate synthase [Desulfobulbus oligotrophicus]MDY0391738.1 thiamine phosphate synthase [Desulfobulbus oligotrophicus]QQG66406.1 thiamine phosphate synthase [Desulfobulbus oligotrophicus]
MQILPDKPTLPPGLYGITAEKFSAGRSNIEVVAKMIEGGIRIVQYREKRPYKSYGQMLAECRIIRKLTRDAGVLFIVNDYIDIALLTDADGVHVGQDDLPVPEIRRLLGPDRLIGLSTHDPEQAAAAVDAGADYIGVGPLFSTQTKEDVCAPVGLAYLEHVVRTSPLPFVAIGGIKESNLPEVIARGAKTVCLVTEIVAASDIVAMVQRLNAAFL